ncbi:hypothetical protein KUV80_00190 [Fictibacillus nanhaiensis]|uniref:hypothetical protein n=1 Tax=Fictibacillus nanhaiensis TaxID=742169 RepID=UPI001C97F9D7|nr:hypothetical protein [Fictibacillus nanhaiensis]MBY6035050.1 hypothetical protein [Fictibacillus nanhaiensis]
MKIRKRAILFVVSSIVTIGFLTGNAFNHKTNAIEENKKYKPKTQSSVLVVNSTSEKDLKTMKQSHMISESKKIPVNHKISPAKIEEHTQSKVENKTVTNRVESETKMPDEKMIYGSRYVNIMSDKEGNLSELIKISQKHGATLYAIDFSDCFAMFKGVEEEPIMLFSTGFISVSIDHVGILYDMHPFIEEQIKSVLDTGKEMTVEVGEFESYHISKNDETLFLSY